MIRPRPVFEMVLSLRVVTGGDMKGTLEQSWRRQAAGRQVEGVASMDEMGFYIESKPLCHALR